MWVMEACHVNEMCTLAFDNLQDLESDFLVTVQKT